uniref:Uncharacterized LOC100177472 n=1 Tax=Ciona intestinalis TaxID=7719 RepID=F6SS18_CIOIN|nr:uncharacterized protein LOC100177472 [Ciona intestinalis]|eukprot:XP_002131928.1 uncharacterized protein LOC100177472 [Ciona intestinalis]
MVLHLKLVLTTLCALGCLLETSTACRSEVCRRKRSVITQPQITLQLEGCTGRTKPWLRQVSYCLDKSSAEVALKIKSWYARTYTLCSSSCNHVRAGTRDRSNIGTCVDCFKTHLLTADFMQWENVTFTEISDCLDRYIYAALSNEVPSYVAETRARGKITLPQLRPANNWWSLTVKLPCKPPLFQFWNAYCINSFADDVRARDFVLTQNKLVKSRNIIFLATFSESCRFDVNDVEIVWSESVPAFAAPQVSSFPRSIPPAAAEFGNIFFNQAARERLRRTDTARLSSTPTSSRGPKRRRRNVDITDAAIDITPINLGVKMPCTVRSFEVSDEIGVPVSVQSNGKRHLLDTSRILRNIDTLNFTLDYGYSMTGCLFGSSEAEFVINPPPGWLAAQERIQCYTCHSANSEAECLRNGRVELCPAGFQCQSETRQISINKITITKRCKQSLACENNYINNNREQCRPGHQPSVCRCCCGTHFCNDDSLVCT